MSRYFRPTTSASSTHVVGIYIGTLLLLASCHSESAICSKLVENEFPQASSVRDALEKDCNFRISEVLNQAPARNLCLLCLNASSGSIGSGIRDCSTFCTEEIPPDLGPFASLINQDKRFEGLGKLVVQARIEAARRDRQAPNSASGVIGEEPKVASPQDTEADLEQDTCDDATKGATEQAATGTHEMAAKSENRLGGDHLWQVGNRWVYRAERVNNTERVDEAAFYELMYSMEVGDVDSSGSSLRAAVDKQGGMWRKQKLSFEIDDSCIQRRLQKGNARPLFCLSAVTEDTLTFMGRELDVLKFSHQNTTNYFSPKYGFVKRIFEYKNGRSVTETLVGFKIGDRSAGSHDWEPTTCEWGRKRLSEKHSTLVLDENDGDFTDSVAYKIAQKGSLSATISESIDTRLRANSPLKKVIALTDETDSAIAFLNRSRDIEHLTTFKGAVEFLKTSLDKAENTELVAVGIRQEDSEHFFVQFYQISAQGLRSASVKTTIVEDAQYDIHLIASTEGCYFRLWEKLDADVLVADFVIKWQEDTIEQLRGSLEF